MVSPNGALIHRSGVVRPAGLLRPVDAMGLAPQTPSGIRKLGESVQTYPASGILDFLQLYPVFGILYMLVSFTQRVSMRVAIVGKGRWRGIQGRKKAKAQKSPMFYINTS